MNLKESKIILSKINLLFENLLVDNKVSSIERDLMLSYVRQFYDEILNDNVTSTVSNIVQVDDEIEEEEITTFVPPVVEKVEPVQEKVTYKKPVIIKIPDSLKDYTSNPETNNQYQAPTPPPPPAPEPVVVPEPVYTQPTATQEATNVNNAVHVNIDPKFAELFEFNNSNDVSDKLSAMPIDDLKKSIGLNEKILTINDLYDGDHRLFDKSLDILNSFSTFNEAKVYIAENLAAKFDWTSPMKVKKAKIFIKLIKRRYN